MQLLCKLLTLSSIDFNFIHNEHTIKFTAMRHLKKRKKNRNPISKPGGQYHLNFTIYFFNSFYTSNGKIIILSKNTNNIENLLKLGSFFTSFQKVCRVKKWLGLISFGWVKVNFNFRKKNYDKKQRLFGKLRRHSWLPQI